MVFEPGSFSSCCSYYIRLYPNPIPNFTPTPRGYRYHPAADGPGVWAEGYSGMTLLCKPGGHLEVHRHGVQWGSGGKREQPLEAHVLGTNGGHGALNAESSTQREIWEVRMYSSSQRDQCGQRFGLGHGSSAFQASPPRVIPGPTGYATSLLCPVSPIW